MLTKQQKQEARSKAGVEDGFACCWAIAGGNGVQERNTDACSTSICMLRMQLSIYPCLPLNRRGGVKVATVLLP